MYGMRLCKKCGGIPVITEHKSPNVKTHFFITKFRAQCFYCGYTPMKYQDTAIKARELWNKANKESPLEG